MEFASFTNPDTLQAFTSVAVAVFGSGGAAWVGVKHSLNGTKERVKEIAEDVKETRQGVQELRDKFHNHEARIVVLEFVIEKGKD